MSRAVMQQALEALESGGWYIDQLEMLVYPADDTGTHEERAKVQAALTALRAALAEPEQEPVIWVWPHQLEEVPIYSRRNILAFEHNSKWHDNDKSGRIPLYTAPTPRKPLTDEEIVDIWAGVSMDYDDEINIIELARALERAHGIGEQT